MGCYGAATLALLVLDLAQCVGKEERPRGAGLRGWGERAAAARRV